MKTILIILTIVVAGCSNCYKTCIDKAIDYHISDGKKIKNIDVTGEEKCNLLMVEDTLLGIGRSYCALRCR